MNSIDITISVIVCIVGLAIGLFFGLLPIKTDNMTEEQNKWQQFAAVIGIGLVLALSKRLCIMGNHHCHARWRHHCQDSISSSSAA